MKIPDDWMPENLLSTALEFWVPASNQRARRSHKRNEAGYNGTTAGASRTAVLLVA